VNGSGGVLCAAPAIRQTARLSNFSDATSIDLVRAKTPEIDNAYSATFAFAIGVSDPEAYAEIRGLSFEESRRVATPNSNSGWRRGSPPKTAEGGRRKAALQRGAQFAA
jgi:hypothetical protein